jgi:hypothetical protein
MPNQIVVTGHNFTVHANPRYCDKLEIYSTHNGNQSWYMLDISKGDEKRPARVQSATCIPFGSRAMPRNVTNKMPHAITAWVATFLANRNQG